MGRQGRYIWGLAAGGRLATIAEFITGTVNESLKKLVQPVGLIPGAIFVLLNLAFVYPSARHDGNQLATAFASLDIATQSAVVALLAMGLGYFLLSGSSTILDVLGGQQLRGSTLYSLLVSLQKRRRARLTAGGINLWYASRLFYLPREHETREPLPTSLGNVLVATQGTVERRYGIDMAALWSQLVATPELKDLPARAIVMDERASRDILCNTAFVLWVFALEGLVFFTFRGRPGAALLSLIAVPAAWAVYRAAVAKAEAWGDAVETLIDLHRDKLHDALKLAPYSNASEERRVWERATRFFVSVDDPAKGDDVFKRTDAPAVTAIPSGEIIVPSPVSAVVDGRAVSAGSTWLRWIEYIVLVARRADGASETAELLVDDPRVVRIPADPGSMGEGNIVGESQVVRGSDGSDLLLWRLKGLAAGSAISLRYKLPLLVLETDPAVALVFEPGVGFVFDRPAADDPSAPRSLKKVRLSHFGTSQRRPELRLGNEAQTPTKVDGDAYVWEAIPLDRESVWIVPPEGTFR